MPKRVDYEARFFAALKRIVAYDSPARLRRESERSYGVEFEEALEMAYDNIQAEARNALLGYRRPKPKVVRPAPEAVAASPAQEER